MSGAAAQPARAAALFDSVADEYDSVGVDFFQPIAGGLVHELAPTEGEHWLDIGCGRGAVLIAAARAIGPRGRALGIDISPRMVERCLETAEQEGLATVEARVDDAQAPGAVDGSFDVVSSSLVLFFLDDPAAALRSWLPLLRPGGRLGATTLGRMDDRWSHVDEVFDVYRPPQLKDARTTGKVGPFGSDEGMAALVAAAGYVDVRTVSVPLTVRFADAEQWHAFTWSVGQRAMWLSVPEAERPAVRAEAEMRLARSAAPDGSIEFEQVVRHTLARRPQ